VFPVAMNRTRYVALCQHGLACPGVAAGGDGQQTWRVAVNILNKLSRTTGEGLTTPHSKKDSLL
jgi:hypothetical protein